jgi:glycosyltransferase involved in cell wall biosynthesis
MRTGDFYTQGPVGANCQHSVPKVLLDLRMVRGALHGIARYALELARRLPALDRTWEFAGLTGPEGLPGDLGELTPRIPLERCPAEFLSPFEQPVLATSLARVRPNLFHATSFSLPALWGGTLVATIHDANHLELKEGGSATRTAYYRFVVAPRARRAEALITVSDFSREQISRHLKISPYRLQVIPNGVDALFRTAGPAELADFRARRGLPAQYFAAIGSPKPHKNLKLLTSIAASLPAKLVLLAGRGSRRALGFPESVLELSPLSDPELALFYAGAIAVLVPSRYEGFGLPALEAMSCGAPVIASDAGAHREILGQAGLLLSADDPSAWKDGALRLFRDSGLRQQLIDSGRERSARYTWDDCAQQTLEVYRRALAR